ncbi:hypothetical protein QAD02_004834 [Eretmocerus hayati]|uniref:Uncharacterized protein n=1 Tax=Eretmocerus hayati TaxID=131215 RepID=A0ACC2NTM3_9HYME|nr:hypothetical protein QAD02_004834 [Eretmocerus hayati]
MQNRHEAGAPIIDPLPGLNVDNQVPQANVQPNIEEAFVDSADEIAQDLWRQEVRRPGAQSDISEETDGEADVPQNRPFQELRDFLGQEGNNARADARARMSKAEILLGFLVFALVFALSQDGLVELLKLVNLCFGLNFLPDTRYLVDKLFMNKDVRTANPVTCAVWFGKSKPNMDIYLDIFVREMTELENNGVDIEIDGVRHNIKLFAICSCVDSIARAPMQGLHQCGGYYSCNWCYIRGNWVESGSGGAVKYLIGNGPSNERTQETLMADVHESHESGFVTRGVNHTSRLLGLRFFDIVKGFVPDFMHFLCLGIAKQFFEFWWRMMTPLERSEMDRLISSIKVPNVVQRLSRSVKDRKYWKSKEWENWVLYYSLPVMMQIQSLTGIAEHWSLLVQGFSLLLCPTITRASILRAHESFVAFVTQTEFFYGPAMMTFNVHQLLHAAQSVLDWGPFWARSGYCFESNNGTLKEHIHSPKGVINQLCRYVSMKQSALIMTAHVAETIPESPILGYVDDLQHRRARSAVNIGASRFFGPYRAPTQDESTELFLSANSRAYLKMVKDGCQYGTDQSRAVKSDNSYVKISDGRFMRINKFIVDNADHRAFAVGYFLNVEPAFIDQESPIHRVVSRDRDKSFINCYNIVTVCVSTEVNNDTFLTIPPNLLRS